MVTVPNKIGILHSNLNPVSTSNPLPVVTFGSLVPKSYDYIELSYTGTNLTGVIYKNGGASGSTITTLTLPYSGTDLTSITKA